MLGTLIPVDSGPSAPAFDSYVERYRAGTCRDRIVHDLILEDARRLGDDLAFLDIGCGKGFDTDIPLQQSLAAAAGRYIGIEPDPEITPGEHVQEFQRCILEQADLPAGSVHVAFAIMVLEHLADPQPFWDKLHEVLADGGVFWGLTVDRRHWFCQASLWSERLRLKEWYLNRMFGSRGKTRYENYPVYYRCNTERQIEAYATRFSSLTCLNLSRLGQCDGILPRFLRPLYRRWENRAIRLGKPGTLLLVRAEK